MVVEDQSEVIEFLASPATHGGAPVSRIDTHTAVVCLAGDRAWKLKRAVRFDYVDFSTVALRQRCCEAELRVNRRTAPSLYLRVVPVTRQPDGALAIGGTGMALDWLLEMRRFDQEGLLDRLAEGHRLDLPMMRRLGAEIARLHLTAAHRPDHGGSDAMAWVIDGNAAGLAEAGGIFDASACGRVNHGSSLELVRQRSCLDARRANGFVRECHGDLHLRNIVVVDGKPTLFDAIEFNDELSCIDVHYDLAFLLMDLWHRRLPSHANAVWNGYLTETRDVEGARLMPLFLSCRAAIRAKTTAAAVPLQTEASARRESTALAREYLSMAAELLRPPGACVVAIGGLSGTGKSTLAFRVAPFVGPVPGAVVVRSDEVRKRLCGVAPLDRLDASAYTPDVSQRVYATMLEDVDRAVRAGQAAIVDAVFARPDERKAVEDLARRAEVPIAGIWLHAPADTLLARVENRRDDPSDADAGVVRQQAKMALGAIAWHPIDAGKTGTVVARTAIAHLATAAGDRLNGAAGSTV